MWFTEYRSVYNVIELIYYIIYRIEYKNIKVLYMKSYSSHESCKVYIFFFFLFLSSSVNIINTNLIQTHNIFIHGAFMFTIISWYCCHSVTGIIGIEFKTFISTINIGIRPALSTVAGVSDSRQLEQIFYHLFYIYIQQAKQY